MLKKPVKLTDERYRLGYHVSASQGWINDPNGFCYFNGYYHIFFQHHPYSSEWGPMHWGHARSKDLVHWEELPIALTPGDIEDKDGCFSGSAIVKDDVMYLFYTGHHYYGDNDPDHFWQNQNMAYSKDGIHFTKYENNPIIEKEPEDNTHHFRDPKVWLYEDKYYMILGSQGKDGLGRGIIYTSSDLINWDYEGDMSKASSLADEGFMWECPDFFHLDRKEVLLLSPQGMEESGKNYLNLFQTGYFVGQHDYLTNTFHREEFTELDRGHDFYATQTTEVPDGRRIVFGWMAMWESDMPEKVDGWAGALTLPRELRLKDNHLYMSPVKELEKLRTDQGQDHHINKKGEVILAESVSSTEILIEVDLRNTENQEMTFALKDKENESILSLTYSQNNQELILNREDVSDPRFGMIQEAEELSLRVFIDKSSVEIFINEGEVVFTERFYAEEAPNFTIETTKQTEVESTVYKLNHSAITYLS
ncbi:glycoside hydrolase family 32 protein [Vagococcus hydrophili]|uniref:Sucrose-6-phosphate hydrolase n=1 Tax=Vagococcus hydrophili TaxID=2714947 RepID=A0A6G8AU96_9ENTE|nr:glycoside hydrolase family 32 protein [Vagococcus hydrophili]QIL48576.1 glycoside hydrolase family 32 protein [Vagococcus hydrophili]